VIRQLLGQEGLAALIGPGDRVTIKPNMVGPKDGARDGYGIITDARVLQHVANLVRSIIGPEGHLGTASLRIIEGNFSKTPVTQDPGDWNGGFYWARLERTGDNSISAGDVCYDGNHDGLLDGGSDAVLVNLDALNFLEDRFETVVNEPSLGQTSVWLPKLLRTREQAVAAGEPEEYTDFFIGIPCFKNHRGEGITGGLKGHYGLRWIYQYGSRDAGRNSHSGTNYQYNGPGNLRPVDEQYMDEYISAMHQARPYDFIILDALVANRRGPLVDSSTGQTDCFESHALLAAFDAVALDTVESLLAGYDPGSIPMIHRAALDGVGCDEPAYIRVAGLNAFTQHRNWLYDHYNPDRLPVTIDAPYGRYPFVDGWGNARLMDDFDAPANVVCGAPVHLGDGRYRFAYETAESKATDSGLARIDLVVDGLPMGYEAEAPAPAGAVEADLSGYAAKGASASIAAWDQRLNCTVSTPVPVDLALEPAIASSIPPETVGMGSLVVLTASANGSGLKFQWYKDGAAIDGATQSQLAITDFGGADAGSYYCSVTGASSPVETERIVLQAQQVPLSGWAAALCAALLAAGLWTRLKRRGPRAGAASGQHGA
jgi:uncharacterized protein (DUF362 family)